MIWLRGIPLAVIICFLYIIFIELIKSIIANKDWHDKWIPFITTGIALAYGCVAAAFFNVDFYDSVQVILGILASDNIFQVVNKLIPKVMDAIERK